MAKGHRGKCKPEILVYAKRMRKAATPAEMVLRTALKGTGYKFRSQVIILGWIVDFWCPSRRLVVEVDGDYHETPKQRAYDTRRTEIISSHMNAIVIRVKNKEVLNDLPNVVQRICNVASEQVLRLRRRHRRNENAFDGRGKSSGEVKRA